LQTVNQVFLACDLDKNGYVSKQEFFKVLKENKEVEEILGHRWKAVFEEIDRDDDGKLTWFEFRHYLLRKPILYVAPMKARFLRRIRPVFDALDINKDGYVTKKELFTALRQKNNKLIEDLIGHRWSEAFDKMDTNNDNKVSWREFKRFLFAKTQIYLTPPKRKRLEVIEKAFEKCDHDKDGYITKKELIKTLRSDKNKDVQQLMGPAWMKVMTEMDVDQDGKITWPEFRYHLLRTRHEPYVVPQRRTAKLQQKQQTSNNKSDQKQQQQAKDNTSSVQISISNKSKKT